MWINGPVAEICHMGAPADTISVLLRPVRVFLLLCFTDLEGMVVESGGGTGVK